MTTRKRTVTKTDVVLPEYENFYIVDPAPGEWQRANVGEVVERLLNAGQNEVRIRLGIRQTNAPAPTEPAPNEQ